MSTFSDIELLASIGGSVNRTRTVRAPSSSGAIGPAAVISVQLEADEDVVWRWTHYADGRSVVTGYTIIKAVDGK